MNYGKKYLENLEYLYLFCNILYYNQFLLKEGKSYLSLCNMSQINCQM